MYYSYLDTNKNKQLSDVELNKQWQGVDKDPKEEKGKGEQVTNDDLKGKKVDANPTKRVDKPLNQDHGNDQGSSGDNSQ